jgi:Tfp pilus assembly protein PilN
MRKSENMVDAAQPYKKELEICADAIKSRLASNWEINFCLNIGGQLRRGIALTEKQQSTLDQIERKIYAVG